MSEKEFHTFREYMKHDGSLTAAMEDYLEMICRLAQPKGFTRINSLATALNVQPPSATKMVQKLAEIKLVDYEKYGILTLSQEGQKLGQKLLERHNMIEDFLRLLGITKGVLEETEKIEHTINTNTLKSLTKFVSFLKSRPDIIADFEKFKTN